MRLPFALAFGVLAASCAAPPESSTPTPSESALHTSALAPAEPEPERGLLESQPGNAPLNYTSGEPTGEAQEPIA
jgi:hypothetical protein